MVVYIIHEISQDKIPFQWYFYLARVLGNLVCVKGRYHKSVRPFSVFSTSFTAPQNPDS